MPTIVKCAGCGAILAEFSEIPINMVDLVDFRGNPKRWIQQLHGGLRGHCPKCGRKLSNKIVDCDVNPFTEKLGGTSS